MSEGRRVHILVVVYAVLQISALVLAAFVEREEGRLAYYVMDKLARVGVLAVVLRALYRGVKDGKRVLVLLFAFGILIQLFSMAELDVVQTDYSKPGVHSTNTVYISWEGARKWEQLGKAEIGDLQKREKERVRRDRILMAFYLVIVAAEGVCLFIVVRYQPVKEYCSHSYDEIYGI